MTLKTLGEFGFIRRVSRGCLVREEGVVRGIGDDAAVFRPDTGNLTLVTTDLLIERVHFLRDAATGFELGHKAMAVNLSDIAAMGGTPREAFVSIAIPDDCPLRYLEDLYDGMRALAASFDVNILGGDTTGSKSDLVLNITVIGQVREDELLLRSGARPGDIVYSTGTLGDSRAGLYLILNRIPADSEPLEGLRRAHLLPQPHLEEGRFLAKLKVVTAAIDVSDGLAGDIGHLARESGVGVRLYADRLPVSDPLRAFCRRFGQDPVAYALAGGEDYTLLLTVRPDSAADLERRYRETFDRPLYCMGEIIDNDAQEIVSPGGGATTIAPGGWDHFRA